MKLPYIDHIYLEKNYVYLTDKLMGIKVITVDKQLASDRINYEVVYIGNKNRNKTVEILSSGSSFATNKIVRNGKNAIYAFSNITTHANIYITDLFLVTRDPSNIYDKGRAFFSAIIDVKDKINIDSKYNSLYRAIGDLPF